MTPSQRLSDFELDFTGLRQVSLDANSLSWPTSAQPTSSVFPSSAAVPRLADPAASTAGVDSAALAPGRPGAHRAEVPAARRASVAASLMAALLVAGTLASAANGSGGGAVALARPATPIAMGTSDPGATSSPAVNGSTGPFVGTATKAAAGGPTTGPAEVQPGAGSTAAIGTTAPQSPRGGELPALTSGGGAQVLHASGTGGRSVQRTTGGSTTSGRPATSPRPGGPHPSMPRPSSPRPSVPRPPAPHPSSPSPSTPHVPIPRPPAPSAPTPPSVPHVPVFTPPKRIVSHFPTPIRFPVHLPSRGNEHSEGRHSNGHGGSHL